MKDVLDYTTIPTKEDVLKLAQEFELALSSSKDDSQAFRKLRHEVSSEIKELVGVVSAFGSLEGPQQQSNAIKFVDSQLTLDSIKHPQKSYDFNLDRVVTSAVRAYQTHPDTKKKEVYVHFDEENTLVNANPIDVKKTIYNFLTNVDRHSDSPVIEAVVKTYDDCVGVSVIDFGTRPALKYKSTEKESLDHIFAPGSSGANGFGDAMSVYRQDLRRKGGDIIVDYALRNLTTGVGGVGTKFTALLPYAKKD